jgi:hypothetical protein
LDFFARACLLFQQHAHNNKKQGIKKPEGMT